MPHPAGGSCRSVAPLLARYNDPDLTEAESVRLSTHLLGCPACRARLAAYRAGDRALRQLPAITLSNEARGAILCQLPALAAAAPRDRRRAAVRRQGVTSVAVATLAIMLVGGFGALGAVAPGVETPEPSRKSDDAFSRSLAATLLIAPPTQAAIAGMGDSARGTPTTTSLHRQAQPTLQPIAFAQAGSAAVGAPPTATGTPRQRAAPVVISGAVRAVWASEGRLQVRLDATGQSETYAVAGDARVVLPDGRHGSLADLRQGMAVRLQLDRTSGGATVVEEIAVLP